MDTEDYAIPPGGKPEITRKEISWHATVAAIRARRQAEALGIDPQAKAALIHAASAETGTAPLPPIVLGTLWAMEETEPHLATLCGPSRYADQALLCHTLLEPERVLLAALAGDLEDIRLGMLHASATLSPDRATALDQWFAQEMARLKHLAGGSTGADPSKKN